MTPASMTFAQWQNESTFWEQRTFKTDMDNTISFIENAQNIKRLRVYVDPLTFTFWTPIITAISAC